MSFQGRLRIVIRPFTALYKVLVTISNVAGMFGIVLMLAMIFVDICGRVFFNSPLAGVPELVRLMIVCIVFLQLSRTLELGQLIRSEGLLALLPSRVTRVLEVIYSLVGAGALWVIFVYSWHPMLEALASHEVEASGLISVPVFPVRLIVLLGSGLVGIRFIANAVLGLYSLLCNPESLPIRGTFHG